MSGCRVRARLAQTAIGLSLVVSSACTDRPVASVRLDSFAQEVVEIAVEVNRNLDLLFVIDNSGSMENEQSSLGENFVKLINEIQSIEHGLPNLHVGVVSTDLGAGPDGVASGVCASADGDSGLLQNTPRIAGCSGPTARYIQDIEDEQTGERVRNYQGTLEDAFKCIALLGSRGCGFEQQLEAMKRALDGSNPSNAGFLRKHARLAVVFITDEDDCSTQDLQMFDLRRDDIGPQSDYRCFEHGVTCEISPAGEYGEHEGCTPKLDSPYMKGVFEYVQFLRDLKDNPDRDILVAGIIGDKTEPIVVAPITRNDVTSPKVQQSCFSGPNDTEGAFPPVRLSAFLEAFHYHYQTTICDEDLSAALAEIGGFIPPPEGGCVSPDLKDIDPDQPGLQPSCVVSEIRDPYTSKQREKLLPQCSNLADPASSSQLPCYTMLPDPEICSADGELLIKAYYPLDAVVPPSTMVRAYCER